MSAKIPLAHYEPIFGGKHLSVNEDGTIEFETNKFKQLEGSYSSKFAVRTLHHGPDGEIFISGNPVKFLQGHNLYGATDVVVLVSAVLERIFDILHITPTTDNLMRIKRGDYTLTRVDVTAMYELPSLADVLAWIRAAAHASRSRHKNAGILKGDTLYWGKNSRHWAMKAYAKGQEILAKDHTLPDALPHREQLIEWAQNKLRIELVLRPPALKRIGANTAASFCNQRPDDIFDSYRNKIILPDNVSLSSQLLDTLPRGLRTTYALWESGQDLRKMMSKNTYYAHRRKLLAHGVDISVKPTDDMENKLSFEQILKVTPIQILTFDDNI